MAQVLGVTGLVRSGGGHQSDGHGQAQPIETSAPFRPSLMTPASLMKHFNA